MVRINLLPWREERRKHRQKEFLILLGALSRTQAGLAADAEPPAALPAAQVDAMFDDGRFHDADGPLAIDAPYVSGGSVWFHRDLPDEAPVPFGINYYIYPLMWGGIVALFNYIPYFGPVIAALLLTVGGVNYWLALILALGGTLFFFVGRDFFPIIDGGQIQL